MSGEALTEDERKFLGAVAAVTGPKALRLIDALATRAEAAERAKTEWERLRNEAYSLYRTEAEKREAECAALRAELTESEGFRSAMRGQLDKYTSAARSACAREMRDQIQHQGACNTQTEDLERWAVSFEAVQALRVDAEAECATLRSELQKEYAARGQDIKTLSDKLTNEREVIAVGDGIIKALRAEVERLRRQVVVSDTSILCANELRARLAAATELLRRWTNFDFDCPEEEYDEDCDSYAEDGSALERLYTDTAAFLAAQPAAPARTKAEPCGDDLESALACLRSWEPEVRMFGNVRVATLLALLARTEAEQAVLDAMADLTEEELLTQTWGREVVNAELARREAAK